MKKHMITSILVIALCICMCQSANSKAAPIRLNQKNITLKKGCKCTLKIKGAKNGKSVKWTSSNKKIACVNKNGVVTAKKKGCVTVTARLKNKKLCCKITVNPNKTLHTNAPCATQCPASDVNPGCSSIPDVPKVTQPPKVTQTPTVTQAPAVQSPSDVLPNISDRFPSLNIPGLNLWIPNVTQRPSATQAPAASSKPSDNSSSSVTEERAYQILNSLRSTYPEGMYLTNSYYYYSPCFGNGYGCYGFAAKLSDTVFGVNTPCSTHTSFDRIKVGDNIRIGNSHSVIVLTKNDTAITVVEGNYNSSVHWDRTITKTSLAKDGFKVTTRY